MQFCGSFTFTCDKLRVLHQVAMARRLSAQECGEFFHLALEQHFSQSASAAARFFWHFCVSLGADPHMRTLCLALLQHTLRHSSSKRRHKLIKALMRQLRHQGAIDCYATQSAELSNDASGQFQGPLVWFTELLHSAMSASP
ncbi:MAG: hypothetical protein MHM6MM_006005 [Cercozoa sp. M6MM]